MGKSWGKKWFSPLVILSCKKKVYECHFLIFRFWPWKFLGLLSHPRNNETLMNLFYNKSLVLYFIDCLRQSSENTKSWYLLRWMCVCCENFANVSVLWVNTCNLRWNVNRLMSLFNFGNVLWSAEGLLTKLKIYIVLVKVVLQRAKYMYIHTSHVC